MIGFFLLNKPAGRTSASCLQEIKYLFKPEKIKIGHAGTLDSFATGLLIIAIGRQATRHMKALESLDKTYIAKGKLGQLTDTLDLTGTVIKDEEPPSINKQMIESVLQNFGSSYIQKPPLYSALKHQGRSLSDLARRSKYTQQEFEKLIESKSREVKLYSLELINFDSPFFTIKAHVSTGTYIRSLINDIGKQLETHATTYELTRTHVGPFKLENALSFDEIDSKEDIEKSLIDVDQLLQHVQNYKDEFSSAH